MSETHKNNEMIDNFKINNLLPCPFCNSNVEKIFIGNDYTKKRSVVIKCKTCCLEMSISALKNNHRWCEEEITKKWNKRS